MADPDALRRASVAALFLARVTELAESDEFTGLDGYDVIKDGLLPVLEEKVKEIQEDAE